MRFRRVRERPHEITRVPDAPQIGYVAIGLTILPPEHLPAGITFDDVIEQVADAVREPVEDWYEAGGHQFLACTPEVA